VPTRNEAANVVPLLDAIELAFDGIEIEVLFVDDSDDGTVAAIRPEAERRVFPIRAVHREPHARKGGLGTAVVQGFQLARAPWALVMDADLQHPPGAARVLADCAIGHDVDLVIGSRFLRSGRASGLSPARRVMSRGAHLLAKGLFPLRLGAISDPLSGLFALRLAAVDLSSLTPSGFKILIEILLAAPTLRPAEVGYRFERRAEGASKASIDEMVSYLGLLAARRFDPVPPRVVRISA
jgi:dolichol-phosphate mannosyltransferase